MPRAIKNLRATTFPSILGVTYIDFKNVSNLKQIAKRTLVPQFNPFKEIPTSIGRKIDEFFVLRNYLAHYSEAAKRSLERVYNRYDLRVFEELGVFLLAEGKERKLPRMEVYIINFLGTADIMARFLNVRLPRIVSVS